VRDTGFLDEPTAPFGELVTAPGAGGAPAQHPRAVYAVGPRQRKGELSFYAV